MHVPGQRGGAAIAADLGGGQRVGLVVCAETAVLFRDSDAEQPRAVQVPVVFGREFRIAIVGRGAACKHALAELARPRDDFGLFAVKAERRRIEDRRIQNDPVDRRRRSCLPVPSSCRHLRCSYIERSGIDPAPH